MYKAQLENSVREKNNTALGVVINLPVFQKSVKINLLHFWKFMQWGYTTHLYITGQPVPFENVSPKMC